MAGAPFTIDSDWFHTGTALKTGLQIVARSNQGVWLRKLEILARGTNPVQANVTVQIMKQTSAGDNTTGLTPNTPTIQKDPTVPETIQTTAQGCDPGAAKPWATEPTASDIYGSWGVSPVAGDTIYFPEPHRIPGGERLGIPFTAPADAEFRVIAHCEE